MARGQRQQNVADQIQRELSDLIQRELRDPRIGLVTLTGVEVSADRAHAKVFFTCLEATQAERAAEGLQRAAGFLRSKLARRIKMFSTPELHFHYDESIEYGARMEAKIREIQDDS